MSERSIISIVEEQVSFSLVHVCSHHHFGTESLSSFLHVCDVDLAGPSFICHEGTDGITVFVTEFERDLHLLNETLSGSARLPLTGPPAFGLELTVNKKGQLSRVVWIDDDVTKIKLDFGGDQTDLRPLIKSTRALVAELMDPDFSFP
jgi:hypothetical protein